MQNSDIPAVLAAAFSRAAGSVETALSSTAAGSNSTAGNTLLQLQTPCPSSNTTPPAHQLSTSSIANELEQNRLNKLQNLLMLNCTKTEIVKCLNISRSTLYKLMKKHGLDQSKFSTISDAELDAAILEIKADHPAAGEVMTNGHLKSRGIVVQRIRLRASIHRVDEEGIRERRLHTIRRRIYENPSPNYIWHLDGTHKLIRWKFVVHAAIDGFSRLITYCYCSNNNRADTVLSLFEEATSKFGVPLRVRTDYGVENVRVWEYMLHTSFNTNSVIVGSSVHNQRVERLHRDINTQVINKFYNEFNELEKEGLLDAGNEADLFCLHLVYLPRINKLLNEFVEASNHHSLSTENNKTPLQLFYCNIRLLQLQSLDPSGLLDLNDIVARSNNNVQVSPISNPFDRSTHERIDRFLLRYQHLHSWELFEKVKTFVSFLCSC